MMLEEKVLGTVLRTHSLTEKEWQELLREWQELIRPRLKQISSMTLGDVRYSAPGISFTLAEYAEALPECTGKELLQTRGIFSITRQRSKAKNDRRLHAYGLSRDDIWLVAELKTTSNERGDLTLGPLDIKRDFARLNLDFRRLFNLLGAGVENWMRRRERMFRQALLLHQRFVLECELIDGLAAKLEEG